MNILPLISDVRSVADLKAAVHILWHDVRVWFVDKLLDSEMFGDLILSEIGYRSALAKAEAFGVGGER